MAVDDFSRWNGDGRLKDGGIEDEGVELTVFAAGVGVGWKITEKGFVKFAACKAGVENLGVDASSDGAEMLLVKKANQFTGIAFPDGEEGGHADAGEILLAVSTEIFEEDVAKCDLTNAPIVEDAQGLLHARFIDRIHALRWDEDFVEGQADGFGLLPQEVAPDNLPGDAGLSFRGGGGKNDAAGKLLLEPGVPRHGAVLFP